MTSNPFLVFGVVIILGAAMNFLRFWNSMSSGTRAARLTRINDRDSHMSFDERIAERMRELEREKDAAPALNSSPPSPTSGPTGATVGFGRRQA